MFLTSCFSRRILLLGSFVENPCPTGYECITPSIKRECSLGDLCVTGTATAIACPVGKYYYYYCMDSKMRIQFQDYHLNTFCSFLGMFLQAPIAQTHPG